MGGQPARASLSLGASHFREANQRVREALAAADVVELRDVCAQRYLGCAMPAGKKLDVFGTPGNDMACFLDGGEVEVHGNAQDQIGNTMNGGRIVVHGRCGDAAGYAMRGGEVFIRDDCGWRVGIHMKQYEGKRPVVFIGGNAGDFLGEYMAGGVIVLLGRAGKYLGTGMHGGAIYLRVPPEPDLASDGLLLEKADEVDAEVLAPLLREYNRLFAEELAEPIDESCEGFWRLRPASTRPYAAMYTQ